MRRVGPITFLAIGLAVLLAGTAVAAPAARPASIISLSQLRGTMKRHRGRVLVLHFWATWCGPCLHELPLIAELARDTPAQGIAIHSVSLDAPTAQGAEAVDRVLKGVDSMTRTILRMDNADAVIAQVDPQWQGSIPALFVYDRKGKLHRAHVGGLTREKFAALVADAGAKPVKK